MTLSERSISLPNSDAVFAAPSEVSVPVHLVAGKEAVEGLSDLTEIQRAWISAHGFEGKPMQLTVLPGPDGRIAGVLFGIGIGETGRPCGSGSWLAGELARKLPAGTYHIEGEPEETTAIAWGLGAYTFERYKRSPEGEDAASGKVKRLQLPDVMSNRVRAITEAVWLGRDMINTPANDLGPGEIEAYARALAAREQATCSVICGDDLLDQNFPMIHAVGRASPRAPRLIDMRWGREDAPAVTLVGKGICFDTGGLDLKPASAMLLMKKDMGGAATALTLAAMIMRLKVDVRLRVLIAAAENSVSGNAFRPGDVLMSRAGKSVEIGNTDAEGRLVLADALALADEEQPRVLASFATLTGAARVALGPDLPAMFATDDAVAAQIAEHGQRVADPVWRMPFWAGYDKNLASPVADMNNISGGPFAGAVTAALFLKRFVKNADAYVHFDMFGWRPEAAPLCPKGGEPQVARAMLEYLSAIK
jgi:leucyl aminopeptidase